MTALPFYNPCIKCGGTELRLAIDQSKPPSSTNYKQLVCIKCGSRCKPEHWNFDNKPQTPGNPPQTPSTKPQTPGNPSAGVETNA